MKKEVFEVDTNGYISKKYIKVFDEQGNCLEELAENTIVTEIPEGLYRPKWTGIEWIEDMSQEEIDILNNQPHEPTETEKLQQELASTNAMLLEFMESMLM
jgi:hypothetical protein